MWLLEWLETVCRTVVGLEREVLEDNGWQGRNCRAEFWKKRKVSESFVFDDLTSQVEI